MEVLDVLRSLRQSAVTGQGFRMILCGSIGLHHVLRSLKQQGYKNQAVNDMALVEVPPLDPPVATDLATLLLAGEGLAGDPPAPGIIAEHTDRCPHLIPRVVALPKQGCQPFSPSRLVLRVK